MRLFLFYFFVLVISLQVYSQDKYGLDLQIFYSKSDILIPEYFSRIEATGSGGYDLGIGLFHMASSVTKIKGGIHLWTKSFNPIYSGEFTINNIHLTGKLKEEGRISYYGIYILATYERKKYFIGGGLDFSFSQTYKSDIYIYDDKGNLYSEVEDNDKSFLTEKFNPQFDLLLNLGLKIRISELVQMRPSFEFSIPVLRLFNTGVTVYNPVDNSRGGQLLI